MQQLQGEQGSSVSIVSGYGLENIKIGLEIIEPPLTTYLLCARFLKKCHEYIIELYNLYIDFM
jgi:hypothetical protein